jgi:hypothetical protein
MISELRKVKRGIDEGIYKAIRLVRINENGSRDVVVPFSRATHTNELKPRFELIRSELQRNLPAGTYLIECKTGNSATALIKTFKIIINSALPESSGNETHTKEEFFNPKLENMDFDIDEYKQLLKENANLNANNQVLKLEVEFLKAQLSQKPLSDAPPVSSGFVKALEDNAPVMLNILDKFLEQRDRNITLEEKKLDLRIGNKKIVKKKVKPKAMDEETFETILKTLEELEQSNPESFNATLDEMEKDDPELYDQVCEALGLFDDEEEEEEQKDNG